MLITEYDEELKMMLVELTEVAIVGLIMNLQKTKAICKDNPHIIRHQIMTILDTTK